MFHSLPASRSNESFWHGACGILTLFLALGSAHAAAAQAINVMISTETAPPGATVQIKLSLAKPAAVGSGELALTLDPTVFGGVAAIAAFSAAGDAAGYASASGSHIDIHFASQSASMGSAAGIPLVVITVPLLATAKAGAQTAITADPTGSVWNSVQGSPAYTVNVTPGTVTVGGTVSVSSVSPVSNLTAGTVVKIMGTGFTSGTAVSIPAVSIASQQVLGPEEVDVTLAGSTDLGGKQVTVTNLDGTQVNFFAAPPATPLASIGGSSPDKMFDGVIPLLPTASYPAGSSAVASPLTVGRIVLANPGSVSVEALVEVVSQVGQVSQHSTITIPPGGQYENDVSSLNANDEDDIQVLATGPLRMLNLLATYDVLGEISNSVLAPFTPIAIPPAALSPSGTPIQFYWVTGTAAPQSQSIPVYPNSPGSAPDVGFSVSFSTNSGGDWLSVKPTGGTTCSCSTGPTLTVTANPAGISVGTYEGLITVTPLGTQFQPAGPPVQIAVGLTVTNSPIVNQIVGSASFYPGSPQSTSFSITSDQLAGPFTVNVLTDSGGNWLSATSTSGTTPAQITVTASPGSLAPGVYSGLVTVQGTSGGIFAIPTMLTVPGGAQLLPQSAAVFSMGPGEAPPAPQTFPIPVGCLGSCGSPPSSPPRTPAFQTAVATHSGGNWLSATPANAETAVTISVNPAGLAPGIYTGVVKLTSTQSPAAEIPVVLSVWTGPIPALVASPPALTVSAEPYSSQPVTAGVEILAGYRQAALSVQTTTSSGGNWLTVGTVYSTPGGVQLWFDASKLTAGVYHGDLTVSVPGQKLDVPVTLAVGTLSSAFIGGPPALGAVLNAASSIPGAIAPGEIISIRGFGLSGPVFTGAGGVLFRPRVSSTVPTSVGGVELLVNGQAAPLLYEGPGQVNAIVPYEVAGHTTATVQLLDLAPSPVWSFPVARAAPGIFTLNSAGAGQAAVLNQDNSVDGPNHPAGRGSVIQIFATGIPVEGAVTGSITTSPVFNATPPVRVLIAGVSANVTYAGPAPGQVAGLVQVNAVVPENAPTGAAVPIVLEAAGQQSQTVATIAIQ